MKWDRVRAGEYRVHLINARGFIERGPSGWWWWAVYAVSGPGRVRDDGLGGGRSLTLKAAMSAAERWLPKRKLRLV
jgi:hypothetical protein